MLRDAYAVGNAQRLLFGKKRRTGIALLFRIIPVLVIPLKRQVNLSRLELGLLNTENIRIRFLKKVHKSFIHTGTKSVYIP